MAKKLAGNLALAIFGVIAALFLVEVLFRALVGPEGKRRTWTDRPRHYFMPEFARSLSDKRYSKTKPAGVFRVAVLGDSFSFGPHLQQDDIFSERLERWLNLNSSQKAEVINFAKSGLSTHHQVPLLRAAAEFNPDLVLLQITLNDPEWRPMTKEDRDRIFGGAYLKHPLFTFWQSGRYFFSRLHNSATHRKYVEYFNGLFEDPKLYRNFNESLAKIGAIGRRTNIKVVAVVFPLFTFPIDERYPFHGAHAKIHEALHAAHIPSIDLKPAYERIPPERLQVIPTSDTHPNEIAHRIAAESILAWLIRHSLLPAESLPKNVYRKRNDVKSRRARPMGSAHKERAKRQ